MGVGTWREGIRGVVNLQKAGEHADCAPNALIDGFAYDPATFMAAGCSPFPSKCPFVAWDGEERSSCPLQLRLAGLRGEQPGDAGGHGQGHRVRRRRGTRLHTLSRGARSLLFLSTKPL